MKRIVVSCLLAAGIVAAWAIHDADAVPVTHPAQLTFVQDGGVSRSIALKLSDHISVKDFGCVGDGVADDTTCLQNAINAAYGNTLNLVQGIYKTTATLTITDSLSIVGESADSNVSANVSQILYTGTGTAMSVSRAGPSQMFNFMLSNFRITASGSAVTSATAIGLQLTNSQLGYFSNLTVTNFQAGIGINVTATAGQLGASNTFINCWLYANLVGYKFDGVNATSGTYADNLFGGAVIGVSSAVVGSKCLWVTQFAAETSVFGTDFESAEVIVDLYGNGVTNGGGVRLIGGRTEFFNLFHVRINAGTNRTMLLGHRFVGGTAAGWVSDLGTQTMRLDVDSGITMNDSAMTILNNVPIKMRDTGGTDRQVLKLANNDTLQIGTTAFGNYPQGTWNFGGGVVYTRSAPTYGASVAINSALGSFFDITATNGTAFTVANPTNSADGGWITITIRNTSGGALGLVTWDTLYKMAAWTSPATGNSRSITFKQNGTNWVEVGRTAADVPN